MPKTPTKNRPRCRLEGCRARPALLSGECRWCTGAFCGNHRLPEDHACPEYSTCRQQAADHNAKRLQSGECRPAKLTRG
jgi:predicted nucleic acid binding AN1-type Zn finger protein